MLSERLQEFLITWCNPETDPEETADMLRGPGGPSYLPWLPAELLAAARAHELTPESMAWYTGLGFAGQRDVDDWLREAWPLWFRERYPDG